MLFSKSNLIRFLTNNQIHTSVSDTKLTSTNADVSSDSEFIHPNSQFCCLSISMSWLYQFHCRKSNSFFKRGVILQTIKSVWETFACFHAWAVRKTIYSNCLQTWQIDHFFVKNPFFRLVFSLKNLYLVKKRIKNV